MNLTAMELNKIIIDVANAAFGQEPFNRRSLMERVENELRGRELWENGDDLPSGSVGKKSKGMERIDYSFTPLEKLNCLIHVKRNVWKLPYRPNITESVSTEGTSLPTFGLYKSRDSILMEKRKIKDEYTCQVCGFYLKDEKASLIDCHHLNPISLGERETSIDDLISLCPTCHRLAHLNSSEPLSIEKIRKIRAKIQFKKIE